MDNARKPRLSGVSGILLGSLLIASTLSPSIGFAASEPGHFRIGALLGQVGLFGDPGSGGANAIGVGAVAGYRLDESLALDLSYLQSSHDRVDHQDISVGADYYVGDYETAYPHLSAGMSFITNKFKDAAATGTAAAVYIGGGLELEIQRGLTIGPELRFQKSFEASGKVGNTDVKTVQDSYTLLIRLLYQLGEN